MSTLRERYLHELMMDYVKEYRLHLRVADISTWENFKRITDVKKSAKWLQKEYFQFCTQHQDVNGHEVNGDLQRGIHYTWYNEMTDALQAAGLPVKRDIATIHQLLNATQKNDSAYLSSSESTYNSGEEGTSSQCASNSNKPRSKKRELTNHERFMQIKRNLEKVKRRRLKRQSQQRQ